MQLGRFPYVPLSKYPHLKPEDILTWEAFIAKYPSEYLRVDYDFPVGELAQHTEIAVELSIGGAERVNQYKIDVVAYRENSIDIIELKNKAVPGTIGQVLVYKNLYDREMKPTKPTSAIIIARNSSPDMDRLATEHGVTLLLV